MTYARFWPRFAAHLIDFILINAVEYGLEWAISTPLGVSAFAEQVIGVVISLILSYFYYIELPVKKGTTLGKRYFDLYVVDVNTHQLMTKKQAMLRLLGYVASYAIVGCGFIMAIFHPEKRALHDLIAGTICVKMKKEDQKEASVNS